MKSVKVSKLIPASRVAAYVNNGDDLKGRCTGNTTGQVLTSIGDAMVSGESKLYFNSRGEAEFGLVLIRGMVKSLKLKHLKSTLTYDHREGAHAIITKYDIYETLFVHGDRVYREVH